MAVHRALAAAVALLLVAGSGCRDATRDDTGAAASCASAVVYNGHLYLAQHLSTPLVEGRLLGFGEIPRCDDTGRSTDTSPPDKVALATVEGISPDLAVARHDDDRSVYVLEGVARHTYPPALTEVLHPLTCRSGDQPLELVAELRGIAPVGHPAEFDLWAPYDLWVRIVKSSVERYRSGSVRIRVPAALGRPLSPSDLAALSDGARLSLDVRCFHSGYVARRISVRRA